MDGGYGTDCESTTEDQNTRRANPAAAAESPKVDSAPRFWRFVFWAISVHFAIYLFVLCVEGFDTSIVTDFFPAELGYFKAIAFRLFSNYAPVFLVLGAFDLVGLVLAWQLQRRRARATTIVIYLFCSLGLACAHAGASLYAGSVGRFFTRQRTYLVGREIGFAMAWVDLLIALPALVVLVGLIVHRRPKRTPGRCHKCSYDLRGNVSGRCPECGTAIVMSEV